MTKITIFIEKKKNVFYIGMSRKTTNILRINTPKDVYLITGDTKIIIGFDEAIDQEEIGSIGQNDNSYDNQKKTKEQDSEPAEPEKRKQLSIVRKPNNEVIIRADKIPLPAPKAVKKKSKTCHKLTSK